MAAFLIREIMGLVQNDKIGTNLIAFPQSVEQLITINFSCANNQRCVGIFFSIASQDSNIFGPEFV